MSCGECGGYGTIAAPPPVYDSKVPCGKCNGTGAYEWDDGRVEPEEFQFVHALDADGAYFYEDEKYGLVLVCQNEGGYNSTRVAVEDILGWLRENRPEVLK